MLDAISLLDEYGEVPRVPYLEWPLLAVSEPLLAAVPGFSGSNMEFTLTRHTGSLETSEVRYANTGSWSVTAVYWLTTDRAR